MHHSSANENNYIAQSRLLSRLNYTSLTCDYLSYKYCLTMVTRYLLFDHVTLT